MDKQLAVKYTLAILTSKTPKKRRRLVNMCMVVVEPELAGVQPNCEPYKQAQYVHQGNDLNRNASGGQIETIFVL